MLVVMFQTKVKMMIQVNIKMPKEFGAPSIVSSAFGKSSSLMLRILLVYRLDKTYMATQKAMITYMPVKFSKPAEIPIVTPIS